MTAAFDRAPGDWPRKTRDVHNHHFNSTVWDDFNFRDDDIVVATYAKSGTTWVQQIVAQLIFNGAENVSISEISPWVDLRVPAKEVKLAALEAQTHRRCLKTHLPVDALVFSPRAKYIYIARDGRDVAWSLYNHYAKANALWYQVMNDTPGRVGPAIEPAPASVKQFYDAWMAWDGYPFWPYWENIRSWWAIRDLPNVMLLHYTDLKRDLAGEIRRIAGFLEVEADALQWETVISHCGFDYMKAHASHCAPLGGKVFEGGAESFINRGTNGRWHELLSAADCAAYEARALQELGPDCARWLKGGAQG